MLSDKWQNTITSAKTANEVVAAAKAFLSSWTPAQIAALPEGCRPGEMGTPDDVTGYAFTLVQKGCAGDHQPPVLNTMASFFAAASIRLSEIVAPKDYALRRPLKT